MERGATLADYLRNGVNPQAENGQVRSLARCVWGAEVAPPGYGFCTEAMFETAARNLANHFALVGVTDRFDAFVAAAARLLGWQRVGYVRRKVTHTRPAAGSLSPAERELILNYNALDARLYVAACERADALART